VNQVPGAFQKDSQQVYRALLLSDLAWLEHGFGTSRSAAWNQRQDVASLKQIHSGICLYAGDRAGRLGEGDALITDVPGALVAVRTADCIPILLVDTGTRAVAAVHAGWRGTVAHIAARTVEAMAARFGSRPEDLLAAIGPGIGGCCYEVGPEVAVKFREFFPERAELEGRARVDLPEANRKQLVAAGLSPAKISVAGRCTCCSGGEFYSWRREQDQAGRMLAVVGVTKNTKGAG
jgi:polyphenol oxidase